MKTRSILLSFLILGILMPILSVSAVGAIEQPINVVALGDSYTAGNGALQYEDRTCWRSANSYVQQYAQALRDVGQNATVHNLACTNAVTSDVLSQIASSKSVVANANVVVMTIGGNDVGFVDIVRKCLSFERIFYPQSSCHSSMDKATNRLQATLDKTKDILLNIRSLSPNAEIVLVGYPYLIAKDCFAVGDGNNVRNLQSAFNARTEAMMTYLRRDYGNRFHFMPLYEAFAGGEVCGNGKHLIRGTIDTWLSNYYEWWHPNVEGHAVIAKQLMKLGFQNNSPVNTVPPPAPVYQLPRPTLGQPVYSGLPFECGVVVPYASTYGSYNYNGTILTHGLSIDLPMARGTDVIAPEAGTVYVRSDPNGYGTYIDLHGVSGVIHRMAHLQSAAVSNGVYVRRSQTIGYVGTTGLSTGPHLHYEQRNANSQTPINLGGPTLQWGAKQGSSGLRTTTTSLVSGNCGRASARTYEDIITLSYNHFAYGRSDGYDRNGWGTVKQNVFVPTSVDSCDFDRDGYDEYIVLDASTGRIMIGDPKGSPNGHFYWRQIGRAYTARKIVCGDWNNDGFDDVMMHNTKNVIYFGRSNGKSIVGWRVARLHAGSRPTYWDMCDVNGDGRDDLVSYHAGTKRFLVGYRIHGVTMGRKQLGPRVGNVGGFVCGNFQARGSEEIILWNSAWNGRFIFARFNRAYQRINWYALRPHGIRKPYHGEMAAGDIDGDGIDEFLVNEFRPATNDYSIMVGDLLSARKFRWYPFKNGMQASFLAVGEFVK